MICVGRSSQDGFCDDLARAANDACEAKDDKGRYKFFPNIHDPSLRIEKCKAEVLFLDEFQSKVKDPHDVPLVLNGVIPLNWMPPMADMNLKGMSFNPVIWIMSCNNEFVQHDYSVTAIRDRMHRRLVVLDGKAYDQTCKVNLGPSGDFLGGFQTCKGTFGVWEKYITQETEGKVVSTSSSNTVLAGMPPSSSSSKGKSIATTTGRTISNQKFREVRDTLNITKPRCNCMKLVQFTDLIVELLNAAEAKLQVAIKGAEAVNAKIEVIRETMADLSVEATEFVSHNYSGSSVDLEEDRALSVSSGYASVQEVQTSEHVRASLFD